MFVKDFCAKKVPFSWHFSTRFGNVSRLKLGYMMLRLVWWDNIAL